MTLEQIRKLTDTELDEYAAIHVMGWHKDGYTWRDEHGINMANSIEYIHEWASDHSQSIYHPASNLEWAFQLMDYVIQSGWIFTIWNFGDSVRVEAIRKSDCGIAYTIRHNHRCRAIAEACVLAHMESGKEQPVFEMEQ